MWMILRGNSTKLFAFTYTLYMHMYSPINCLKQWSKQVNMNRGKEMKSCMDAYVTKEVVVVQSTISGLSVLYNTCAQK